MVNTFGGVSIKEALRCQPLLYLDTTKLYSLARYCGLYLSESVILMPNDDIDMLDFGDDDDEVRMCL